MQNDFYKLVKVAPTDGVDAYNMLQRIGKSENDFRNPVNGKNYLYYHQWLIMQVDWSNGLNLPIGYVPQTTFWLQINDKIVGIGKIRHCLTDATRKFGGNIGYAIDPLHRGKGYGNIILKLLLQQADILGVKEKLATVNKDNIPSRKVVEKNGGTLCDETDKIWIFRF